ncbi:MAG: SHOCT domain-containing protein [Clostridia bacterium]|nr:SHOCT domain-containing protein [Clostridia bacterium]
MNKNNYVVYNIMTVIAYFYGIILISTLILLPLGVYSVIAAHRYSNYSEMSGLELSMNKKLVQAWTIFGCVLYFPFGLISLIPYFSISNNVVVNDVKEQEPQQQKSDSEPVEVEIDVPKTESEKAEKLAKLERFKANGLITEDEYNQAKAQLEEDK